MQKGWDSEQLKKKNSVTIIWQCIIVCRWPLCIIRYIEIGFAANMIPWRVTHWNVSTAVFRSVFVWSLNDGIRRICLPVATRWMFDCYSKKDWRGQDSTPPSLVWLWCQWHTAAWHMPQYSRVLHVQKNTDLVSVCVCDDAAVVIVVTTDMMAMATYHPMSVCELWASRTSPSPFNHHSSWDL